MCTIVVKLLCDCGTASWGFQGAVNARESPGRRCLNRDPVTCAVTSIAYQDRPWINCLRSRSCDIEMSLARAAKGYIVDHESIARVGVCVTQAGHQVNCFNSRTGWWRVSARVPELRKPRVSGSPAICLGDDASRIE